MRNPFLYKTLKKFSETALTLLNNKAIEGLPSRTKAKIEILDSGGYSYDYVGEADWDRFIRTNKQIFDQLDVYKAAIEAMKADEKVSRHLDTLVGSAIYSRSRHGCHEFLQRMLTLLLHEQKAISFQENIFNQVYEKMEDYFYREVLEYRYWSLIENFQMESEKIELAPKFSLIKISKEDREEILSELMIHPFIDLPFETWVDNQYALELFVEAPKVFGDVPVSGQPELLEENPTERFDDACSALRLFKKGHILRKIICSKSKYWQPFEYGTSFSYSYGRISPRAKYVLSNEELSKFLEFWKSYQMARKLKRKKIGIAMRRFNFSYEKQAPEDKLIEYIIGFEALLLPGVSQELGYRLALRGSNLLGGNPGERKRIFLELKKGYDVRCDIVHSGITEKSVKIGVEEIYLDGLVNILEDHLRDAIRRFLVLSISQAKDESEVINMLDEQIICGFQPC